MQPLILSTWNGPLRYDSALVQYRDVEGIGELVISGILGPNNFASLRLDAFNHAAGDTCSGLVVDLRRASFALDTDTIPFQYSGDYDAIARMRPIAVVVKPELETLALQWAWEMAHNGLMRGAFTQVDEAHEWVRSRTDRRTRSSADFYR